MKSRSCRCLLLTYLDVFFISFLAKTCRVFSTSEIYADYEYLDPSRDVQEDRIEKFDLVLKISPLTSVDVPPKVVPQHYSVFFNGKH